MTMLIITFPTLTLICMAIASNRFHDLVDIHERHCSCADGALRRRRETPPFAETADGGEVVPCCGYCSCAEICWWTGDCCLKEYQSFQEAADTLARAQYSCEDLQLQYKQGIKRKTSDETSYWLVNKCDDRNSTDLTIKSLCESPVSDARSFESVFPVYGPSFLSHYRNRYCAVCNSLDLPSIREIWKVKVYCKNAIPTSKSNLLSAFQAENCDIIFLPPVEAFDHKCYMPPYTISECNKTGKWLKYDKDVDLACQSFKDPFNFTYQNYFCHLCNTDEKLEPSDWMCLKPAETLDEVGHWIEVTLDLDTIRKMEAEAILKCNSYSQFLDYKQMLCREILCSLDQTLSAGQCSTDGQEKICIGINFNISVEIPEQMGLLGFLEAGSSVEDLKEEVMKALGDKSDRVKQFLAFAEKFSIRAGTIKSLIFNLILDIAVSELSSLSANIQPQRSWNFSLGNDNLHFKMSLDQFHMMVTSSNPSEAEFVVMNHDRAFSTFSRIFGTTAHITCLLGESISYNKILTCPFIKVGIKDFPLKEQGDVLIHAGDQNWHTQTALLNWQYERHGDIIHICLEDYKKIFETIQMPLRRRFENVEGNGNLSSSERKKVTNFLLVLLIMVLYLW